MYNMFCRKTLILYWDLNNPSEKKEQNVIDWRWWQFPCCTVSLFMLESFLQFVWSVEYSVKVLFKRRSQASHFSCFDSNLRIIYISSVSCFMTETTVTVGSFLFPFSHFMNNVPIVLRLLCYYLFMKISSGYWTVVIFYVPLSLFLACSLYLFFFFFLLLNLANLPSE